MAERRMHRAPLVLAAAALMGAAAARPADAGGAVGFGYGYHGPGAHVGAHVGYHHRHHHHHHGRFHYRHHHHGHGAAYTLLGVGLGLIAYDIARKSARAERIAEREVRYLSPPPPVPPSDRDGGCLQIREYQTTITVGGEEKEAYGDACLMPDGSWRLGAPKLVPEP
ncbi:MAG: hypothetical protein KatS3mg119_0809 [Rhodothalassiaceae bacterium]|nr:MAG: hypothetical protein KatS3mg119_0809 [Rhodothalassiaceae bacterium]